MPVSRSFEKSKWKAQLVPLQVKPKMFNISLFRIMKKDGKFVTAFSCESCLESLIRLECLVKLFLRKEKLNLRLKQNKLDPRCNGSKSIQTIFSPPYASHRFTNFYIRPTAA